MIAQDKLDVLFDRLEPDDLPEVAAMLLKRWFYATEANSQSAGAFLSGLVDGAEIAITEDQMALVQALDSYRAPSWARDWVLPMDEVQ